MYSLLYTSHTFTLICITLFCIAYLRFSVLWPIHGSIFFSGTRATRTAAWPWLTVCIRYTVCCKDLRPTRRLTQCARATSAHSTLIRFSCRKFSLLSTDAESLHRTTLRLHAAVTFAGFPHNINLLLRHLGYSFSLKLVFTCLINGDKLYLTLI